MKEFCGYMNEQQSNLALKLKAKVITEYQKFGDAVVLLKGNKSYTGNELAQEIENETDEGVETLTLLLALTIDLYHNHRRWSESSI